MSDLLKELLPNPTFVDYQVPHDGQGADFYDERKMLEYGKRIVKECCQMNYDFLESYREACEINERIREHFGVKKNDN